MCTDEAEYYGHIGTEIKRKEKLTTLKEPQLIERVLLQLNLKEAKPKETSVFKPLLHAHFDGKERISTSFHYNSIIDLFTTSWMHEALHACDSALRC